MDTRCLDYMLGEAEREAFERDGYFIVENALTPEQRERAEAAFDRLVDARREEQQLGRGDRVAVFDFAGRDEALLELVDLPKTFARVFGLLGWNIQLYHSHLNLSPPEDPGKGHGLAWHQDSGRLNLELETDPQPRISLKVGFFLTDCSLPGRGNFYVVPGSQLQKTMVFPGGNRRCELPGGVPVQVPAGSAVFFDRRLWHSTSANHWHSPRKVLFYGYSYRWLRPRDEVTLDDRLNARMDPIRRQLFGASPTGNYGYTSPEDVDVPLKGWIETHVGAEAVAV
ncbi:MAG: phytanoyl-CoA dioxygenase family protein [Anaerolineaceae bacterium]|nr:phytanoyl-CoA dioxygenase family protein [Anaerolineaceae bacterium]